MSMPGKPPRARTPKQLAVIRQQGCTGCEICIVACPVDCIEIVPGVEYNANYMQLVEVDYDRCIGCSLCAQVCPWDAIDMHQHDKGLSLAPGATMRSVVPNQKAEAETPPAETAKN